MKYKGVVCEKGGVEVTVTKVRRERGASSWRAGAHIVLRPSEPHRLLLDMQ